MNSGCGYGSASSPIFTQGQEIPHGKGGIYGLAVAAMEMEVMDFFRAQRPLWKMSTAPARRPGCAAGNWPRFLIPWGLSGGAAAKGVDSEEDIRE